MVLGDGYVGMNCIPRRDGRYSGLDHFGIEVDDIEETIATKGPGPWFVAITDSQLVDVPL